MIGDDRVWSTDELHDQVRLAVLAERERCAKVAETMLPNLLVPYGLALARCIQRSDVVDAIRTSKGYGQ